MQSVVQLHKINKYNCIIIPHADIEDFYSYYQPDSSSLQFVFRGAVIFRAAIQDLRMNHGLNEAEEILLVGSSAGNLLIYR